MNQRLAKIVCTVFKVINSDHAPKSNKELIGNRKRNYDLRGNDILQLPKGQHYDLRFKIVEVYGAKTMELNT